MRFQSNIWLLSSAQNKLRFNIFICCSYFLMKNGSCVQCKNGIIFRRKTIQSSDSRTFEILIFFRYLFFWSCNLYVMLWHFVIFIWKVRMLSVIFTFLSAGILYTVSHNEHLKYDVKLIDNWFIQFLKPQWSKAIYLRLKKSFSNRVVSPLDGAGLKCLFHNGGPSQLLAERNSSARRRIQNNQWKWPFFALGQL